MLKYKDFSRTYAIRYVRDLLSPLVWDASALTFPLKTMLFWFNGSATKEFPTTESGYFTNLIKPYVYSIAEYTTANPPLGNPRRRKVSENSIIKQAKLKEPYFKYIKIGKQITVPTKSAVLFNFGSLGPGYQYIANPLTAYHMWYNALNTVVELASINRTGSNRHKYIIMDLPYSIPNREQINKHLGEPTRVMLSIFTDYTFLNILELFRFIDPKHNERSILASVIPVQEFRYINLVLTINNKVCIVNLELLAAITDTYDIDSTLKRYPAKTVAKIMYIFLNKIITSPTLLTTSEIPDARLHRLSGDNAKDSVDVADLDDIIDNDIQYQEESFDSGEDVDTMVVDKLVEITGTRTVDEAEGDAPINDVLLYDNTAVIHTVETLKDNKVITKRVRDSILETLTAQATKKSPYNDGKTIKDMLTYSKQELAIDSKSTAITDTSSVIDKSTNGDTLSLINSKYLEETMRKDIMSTIYSIQKAGVIIKEHEVVQTNSILGVTEEHTLTTQTVDGSKSTIRIKLPVVNADNTITLSTNKYVMRKLRADTPLKKISNSVVSISSYYGKLFISRSPYKKDDVGYWFLKQLMLKYATDKDIKDIAAVTVTTTDTKVPRDYGVIARYVKGFRYKDILFNFEYGTRDKLVPTYKLSKIENNGVVIGVQKDIPVIMDYNNQIYLLDNNKTKLGDMFTYLDLDTSKAPIEYCTAKIYKKQLPLVVILGYYLGLNKLIKKLKVKHTVVVTGTRVPLAKNEYRIVFKDYTYIVTKDNGIGDLILYGLTSVSKYIKRLNADVLDSRARYSALFTVMELPILYINEIKLMENMYIDPITKQVLELFKLPTLFNEVLIEAVNMLRNDNYKHPNSIDGVLIKGYERISGMLYLELVRALRSNTNKSHFGKSNINVNPYSVINKINSDSSTVLVDDLNPIASLKQLEDVTYLGSHGRKEETMSKETRIMHPSEIGIISEAVKDSGAVGISAYMSANPKLETTRGTVGVLGKDASWSNILSTSAMLAPFATMDDPKRLNLA